MENVFLVLINADFTEGRGPMFPHKVFSTKEKAINYVKNQTGIFGSKQYEKPYISGDSERWNGYDIKTMVLA